MTKTPVCWKLNTKGGYRYSDGGFTTDETAIRNTTYSYTVRCVGDYDNYISSYNTRGSTIKYVK